MFNLLFSLDYLPCMLCVCENAHMALCIFLRYSILLSNDCFSQISFTIVLIEFNCQYKHDGLLQSNAWSMLLMSFFGMPINTLHSLVTICTSYFSLMTFHMYSWACVNVILLYCALITTFLALFLALTLSFKSHFLFPFLGLPPRRVKRKLLPNHQ